MEESKSIINGLTRESEQDVPREPSGSEPSLVLAPASKADNLNFFDELSEITDISLAKKKDKQYGIREAVEAIILAPEFKSERIVGFSTAIDDLRKYYANCKIVQKIRELFNGYNVANRDIYDHKNEKLLETIIVNLAVAFNVEELLEIDNFSLAPIIGIINECNVEKLGQIVEGFMSVRRRDSIFQATCLVAIIHTIYYERREYEFVANLDGLCAKIISAIEVMQEANEDGEFKVSKKRKLADSKFAASQVYTPSPPQQFSSPDSGIGGPSAFFQPFDERAIAEATLVRKGYPAIRLSPLSKQQILFVQENHEKLIKDLDPIQILSLIVTENGTEKLNFLIDNSEHIKDLELYDTKKQLFAALNSARGYESLKATFPKKDSSAQLALQPIVLDSLPGRGNK